jgi:hypothetical protein
MRRVAAAVLLAMLAGAAGAQDSERLPSEVKPGARIRASVSDTGVMIGRVIAVRGDSLHVVADRSTDTVHVAANQLTSLDLSIGRHKRRWAGAGIGFLGGAALGAVLGRLSYQPSNCSEFLCDLGPEPNEIVGALLGAGFGALVGGGIGAGTTDEWMPLTSVRRTSLDVRALPSTKRLAIGASLRF